MTNPTRRRCGGGAHLGLLLVVLALAVGAGAWNYRRNLVAEQQEQAARPLSGYEHDDLLALAAAYRTEVDALTRRYQGVRSERVEARERGFFGDQIDEYERVRRRSGAHREVGAALGEAEAALREIEQELATRRSETGTGLELHLRRLLAL